MRVRVFQLNERATNLHDLVFFYKNAPCHKNEYNAKHVENKPHYHTYFMNFSLSARFYLLALIFSLVFIHIFFHMRGKFNLKFCHYHYSQARTYFCVNEKSEILHFNPFSLSPFFCHFLLFNVTITKKNSSKLKWI